MLFLLLSMEMAKYMAINWVFCIFTRELRLTVNASTGQWWTNSLVRGCPAMNCPSTHLHFFEFLANTAQTWLQKEKTNITPVSSSSTEFISFLTFHFFACSLEVGPHLSNTQYYKRNFLLIRNLCAKAMPKDKVSRVIFCRS